tara:strand:+ start:3363 stop:3839 length:477 start_codon:yes stop_codon:yes gene_type:complete
MEGLLMELPDAVPVVTAVRATPKAQTVQTTREAQTTREIPEEAVEEVAVKVSEVHVQMVNSNMKIVVCQTALANRLNASPFLAAVRTLVEPRLPVVLNVLMTLPPPTMTQTETEMETELETELVAAAHLIQTTQMIQMETGKTIECVENAVLMEVLVA